ncbi:MAG: mismatch repair protein MutT [Frankiales bacterium]|nr:mismatch repair protein MutT [Frankiales bacterium]
MLRVADLLAADAAEVRSAAESLPERVTALAVPLAVGTLVTLEVRRPPWDLRPRIVALRELQRALTSIAGQTEKVMVVAAAIARDDTVLAAQRDHPAALAGFWEFPGGKVEKGESPVAALVRECAEELGVQVRVGPELGRRDLDAGAVLILFAAELIGADEPQRLEHRELRWVPRPKLPALDWLDSNRPLVRLVSGITEPDREVS